MIGSVAFLLEKCLGLQEESDVIWQALFTVLEKGYTTVELASGRVDEGKILSTSDFGDFVVSLIEP